jgi:hypothetical protein
LIFETVSKVVWISAHRSIQPPSVVCHHLTQWNSALVALVKREQLAADRIDKVVLHATLRYDMMSCSTRTAANV